MMKLETKMALEKILNELGNKEFQKEDIKGISWQTFKKYVEIEYINKEKLVEVSIEELVDLLNSCAGDDCWGCNWEYRVIDGKPFEMFEIHSMRIIGVKKGFGFYEDEE